MPNIILTHTINENVDLKTKKSSIFKKAWEYIKNGLCKKMAFKKAWNEYNKLIVSFWTNASDEDIRWTIKSCQSNGVVRTDLLRKWDKDRIQHPLDWVSYHLRRNGFLIMETKPNVYSKNYENIPSL